MRMGDVKLLRFIQADDDYFISGGSCIRFAFRHQMHDLTTDKSYKKGVEE